MYVFINAENHTASHHVVQTHGRPDRYDGERLQDDPPMKNPGLAVPRGNERGNDSMADSSLHEVRCGTGELAPSHCGRAIGASLRSFLPMCMLRP